VVGYVWLMLNGLRLLRRARKPAAKARRKARRIANLLSLESIPGTETGTVMPRLQRQRLRTQATSLGGEPILA
jgi:hypothetical protein